MIGRLLLFAAFAALLAALSQWRLLAPEEEEALAETARPGYYLTGVELREFGADGRQRLKLRAATASEVPTSGLVALADVALDFRSAGDGQDWRLTAATARVAREGDRVEFEGDVTMRGQGSGIPAGAELRTPRLTFDTAREQARSDAAVTLALGAHELQGQGMFADLRAGRLTLETAVHGRFTP